MSTGKHTPGPWQYGGVLDRNGQPMILVSSDNHFIAHVFAFGYKAYNARLIAAAPDLLKALQDILYSGPITENVNSALAAIAKATEVQS